MQQKILILSRCLKLKGQKTQKNLYRFHFRGHYQGLKINEIHVMCEKNVQLKIGDEYLLWVEHLNLSKTILKVILIKYKKIG